MLLQVSRDFWDILYFYHHSRLEVYCSLKHDDSCQSGLLKHFLSVKLVGSVFNIYIIYIFNLYIGQAFRYSPENAFYIFNRQIYSII